MVIPQVQTSTIYYPESDGKPMVETDTHHRVLTGLRFGLEFHFELTSVSTRSEDLGLKRWLYSQLGVKEYFLFDPLRQYLRPSLRGYRLIGDEYVRIVEEPAQPGELRLKSEVLNLELLAKGGQLRLLDPASGTWLPLPAELEAAWREAEARAQAAEAEVERLRTELQRLRGK